MASSNRHWPSMFKSKPTYTTHQEHQWHSSATNRSSPYSSGCEERTPEPKPRWNPKPEQIRILESIFNSGLVNPPRDEIRRIRARLQEYGQVGDANVFYWFQNRKSRSKHKNRHLQKPQNHQPRTDYAVNAKAVTTSSSSSDDKSSSKSIEFFLNSPTMSVNQQPHTYLGAGGGSGSSSSHHQHHGEFFQEPFFSPVVQQKTQAPTASSFTQGFCFSELGTMIDQGNQHRNDEQKIVSSSGMLLTDLMMNHQYGIPSKNCGAKGVEEDNIIKMLSHSTPPPAQLAAPTLVVPPSTSTTIAPSAISDIQGVEEAAGTGKAIVFINDVPFEVAVGQFNVKEAFGGDAMLIDSSGQTVLTNEWGVTLQSLEHGSFYYLVRSFTYDHAGTVDLVHFHPFDFVNFRKV
ncbi:putative transcription factor homeobox-WOX family [Helianthus annuus]|nr:putative transcription factor homeobox-WOX family [Helianthus annuus]